MKSDNLSPVKIQIFRLFFLACVAASLSVAHAKANSPDLIIGGQSVNDQDPLANSVIALYQESSKGASLCSATLIAKGFAVTAAHCVEGGITGMFGIFASDIRSESAIKLPVIAAKISPLWRQNPSADTDMGDIAVIQFSGHEPRGFHSVPIIPKKTRLESGDEVTIAGYGIDDSKNQNGEGILRKTNVIVADPDFGNTEMIFDQSQGKGACHGDSGGPAFFETHGKFYLLGVTNRAYPESAPDDCAHQVVYTKASAYRPWIQQTIKSFK